MMEGNVIKRKVNILGEPGVGKTSLVLRFVKDLFGDEYLKTIGTNVYTKRVPVTGSEVKLVIYDIMGESDFESVRDMAFKQSMGAIAVADCTRKKTLDRLIDDWLPKYRRLATDGAPIVLAVNKVDLEDQEITDVLFDYEELPSFSTIFYTSAKTNKNVEDMFQEVGFLTKFQHLQPIIKEDDILTLEKKIDSPKKLISALLTYSSHLGDLPYSTREKIFEESGIDKFSLDKEITLKEAFSFGRGLIAWYEDDHDSKSASAIRKLLEETDMDVTRQKKTKKEETMEEFKRLDGVGHSTAKALYEKGYRSIDDLKDLSQKELCRVEGIGPTRSEMILKSVKKSA